MALIIASAAAVCVLVLLYATGVLPRISIFGDPLTGLDRSLPESVIGNSNGILYNQNDTLYLMDAAGDEQWNISLELKDAVTVASTELICNYAGKSLQVMAYTKEQYFNTAIDVEILDVAVGMDTVAVLTINTTEHGDNQYFISLFNSRGEQTGYTRFTSEVIDFGFHGGADMLWVLELDTTGVTPVSYITTYMSDGSMTNSIPVNSQIVEDVFVTDSAIFAGGTNTLTSYTYFGEQQAEQSIYGWKNEARSLTPQDVRLVYIPRTTVKNIDAVKIYASDLSCVHIWLPWNIFSVAVTQNRIYAFSDSTAYIYTSDGSLEKQTALNTTVTRVKQLSNDHIILWDAQKSYIMKIN